MKNPWIPILAWMMVIFWFSSRNADESGLQSGIILNFLLGLGIPKVWIDTPWFVFFIRKLAHFTEFFILGLAISRLRWAVGCAVLLILAYAISDEFHQYFVPGRQASWVDVLIDTVGGILGLSMLIYYFRWKESSRERL